MKKIKQLLLAAGLFALAGNAMAVAINGAVAFGTAVDASWTPADSSLVTGTATTANADGVVFNANLAGYEGLVTGSFGDYAGTSGSDVNFFDFVFNPLTSGTLLWSFVSGGDTYSFTMYNATILSQSATQIGLTGSGFASITGGVFDDTDGVWDLTLNQTTAAFSFSSGAAVPEPSIALLLGVGLIGFGFTRRARKAA